jgi:hypothetical protein
MSRALDESRGSAAGGLIAANDHVDIERIEFDVGAITTLSGEMLVGTAVLVVGDGKRYPFRYFNSSPEVIGRVVIDVLPPLTLRRSQEDTKCDRTEEWWWS